MFSERWSRSRWMAWEVVVSGMTTGIATSTQDAMMTEMVDTEVLIEVRVTMRMTEMEGEVPSARMMVLKIVVSTKRICATGS